MDLLLAGLKQLNVVLATIIVVYAWTVLGTRRQRLLFLAMVLSFTVSTVLFFPKGEINEWLKHSPFYMGQLLFFIFVYSLGAKSGTGTSKHKKSVVKSVPIFAAAGDVATVSGSGIEHILAAPLYVIICISLCVKLLLTRQKQMRRSMLYFLLAGTALTMIHVVEYYVESKGYISMLHGEPVEVVELVWFYVACALFVAGLRSYESSSASEG